jgi:hypothetical protein
MFHIEPSTAAVSSFVKRESQESGRSRLRGRLINVNDVVAFSVAEYCGDIVRHGLRWVGAVADCKVPSGSAASVSMTNETAKPSLI